MRYYVYGIVDPDQAPSSLASLSELLGSVIYVGKGTGERMHAHGREAVRLLAQELECTDPTGDRGTKLNRLIGMLRACREPRTIKLMADLESERDAYIAESFAIETIDAHRRALGREPLTNAIAGHGLAVEPLDVYLSRFDVRPVQLEPAAGDGALALLVKGSSDPASENHYELDPDGQLPFPAPVGRAVCMRLLAGSEDRPGWDPHLPWTQEQATTRARRYWPIASEHVEGWLNDPTSAPQFLLLAIRDHGRTVIRYMWDIDSDKPWEFYPDFTSPRWGIPVGEPIAGHALLNTEPRIGSQHALFAVAGGCRQVRIDDSYPRRD